MQLVGSPARAHFADQPETRIEMGRQAPRRRRLEHVVLEDEVARVAPVVRDLARVVIAHHVRLRRRQRALGRVDVQPAELPTAGLGARDEPAHAAAGDVAHRVDVVVRPAEVLVAPAVVRPVAAAAERVGHADVLRDAVRAGVRAEVGVERPVLLHDHDDVPDLVDAGRTAQRPPAQVRASTATAAAASSSSTHLREISEAK